MVFGYITDNGLQNERHTGLVRHEGDLMTEFNILTKLFF